VVGLRDGREKKDERISYTLITDAGAEFDPAHPEASRIRDSNSKQTMGIDSRQTETLLMAGEDANH